nr:hypothetical protein [uncultured Limnobacter sp.]
MTVINPGFNPNPAEQSPADSTSTRENEFVFPDGSTIRAASPEQLQMMLEYLAMVLEKPISELTSIDLDIGLNGLLNGEWPFTSELNPEGGWLYTFTDDAVSAVEKIVQQEFFNQDLPQYPADVQSLFSNPVDLGEPSSLVLAAKLAGLAGAAQQIYAANYENASNNKPLNPAKLNPDLLSLIHSIFGADVTPTQGHLNTLKALGLVEGDPGKGASSWALSTMGQELHETLNNSDSLGLLGDNGFLAADAQTEAKLNEAIAMLQQEDLTSNLGAIKQIAQGLLDQLSESGSPNINPAELPLSSEVVSVVAELFDIPGNPPTLTHAQLNIAIMMGLVVADPAAAGGYSVTDAGQKLIAAAGTDSPEQTPEQPTQTEQQVFAGHLGDFINGHNGWAVIAVEVATQEILHESDVYGNGIWSVAGFTALAGVSPNDEAFWAKVAEAAGVESIPMEARQAIIAQAQLLTNPSNIEYLKQAASSAEIDNDGDPDDRNTSAELRSEEARRWIDQVMGTTA